jgi:DNA-binding NarL/FixJ family response regulator
MASRSATSGGDNRRTTRTEVTPSTNRIGKDSAIANPDEPGAAGTVLIVDDHHVLAQGLRVALESYGFSVVHTDADPPEQIPDLLRTVQPDVVLLDLWLGQAVGSGLGLIGPIKASGARIVILTASEDTALLASCIEAGAFDLANKTEPFSSVLAKVQGARSGEGGVSPSERMSLMSELRRARAAEAERLAPFERLTARERDVLVGLIEGRTAQELASSIPVSLATVRTQIRGILSKLGVGTQLAAVALARRAGWPEDGGIGNHQS